MILIKREAATPAFMKHEVFTYIKKALKEYYGLPVKQRRQQRPPYIPLPGTVLKEIETVLAKEFNGKCAYCEIPVKSLGKAHFDHFRPKSSAKGFNDQFDLEHYWTLSFNWKNMYYSCEACNRYKLNWFPVEGRRASLKLPYTEILRRERNLLIDPCHNNPFNCLSYELNGLMKPANYKGEATIDILKLNRKELVWARKRIMLKYNSLLKQIINASSKDLYNNDQLISKIKDWLDSLLHNDALPYKGIQLYFLEKWFFDYPAFELFLKRSKTYSLYLKITKNYLLNTPLPFSTAGVHRAGRKLSSKRAASKTVSKTRKKPANTFTSNRVIIDSIEIKNFRTIEKLTLQFPKPSDSKKEPWLMLLGENGVGKSSILQAITLSLVGQKYLDKLDMYPESFLRYGATEGKVTINRIGQPPIELLFSENSLKSNISIPHSFILAYGATRLFKDEWTSSEITKGKARAYNLFFPASSLYGEAWLLNLYKKDRIKFDFAARALKSLLASELDDPGIQFIVEDQNIVLKYSDPDKPAVWLEDLSDGYKSVLSLACDMLHVLLKENITIETTEGIVLVDEVGTHLHPGWKMKVVKSFREAFPRLQFIVTTHDPLCLKGLENGEIRVLESTSEGIKVLDDLPDTSSMTAEQLLNSRFFGLNSTIDPEIEKEFNEYYRLLSKLSLSQSEKRKLKSLEKILRDKKHLGNSLREELALSAADTILAEEKLNPTNRSLTDLKKETLDVVQEIWSRS